ncbi:CusA/CzcA family heavy metal efflux RND transporter [Pseudacidobacterium ailaaui]|jgi:cobalt-zinc-cadmium resistance protein CzcA|uniref:CusA/CzcA family heavy metal efflux RND transporter n=1 Tax=Pseudacidobacterium ailaaui TaxID=1382359 RepID=UPI000478838B|nr:CusA/CzcA family heavy metal efflux RND transporter [Pseudacidobacterium ailaaui]MBX6359336.1 efflux RND transporter permease subunit [Pseudacidobacterium ailaaui]MCL6462995.1 CusA/CzcA family heavy metal efflux RND transporter [Pseudacidobacterium ailaaui]MDI3253381.1 CusA/CzcA family heavy metal efflux RND transporter [Bacillota bacterium]
MIRKVVDFALQNRFLVLAIGVLLFAWGIVSFKRLPVEAYPDVANNYVDIIAQWPGISAEQIEQQVTIPIEIAMNGIPGVAHVRSWSLFGLSTVELVFGEETTDFENRERVLERLSQVTLPAGVVPQMGTDWSPVGQIYFYTLESTNPQYDVMELKSLEDWVVDKNLKSVPGVVDTNDFGGPTREYQVRLDPDKLVSYGLSIAQVEQQLTNNNANGGGSFIESGLQQINIREVGLVRDIQDIENTVITTKNGTAIRVKDIAVVTQGPKIRLGQFGRAYHREDGKIIDNDDVVSGIALLQKGADADPVLEGIHKKVQELNDHILPQGVKLVPFIDRSDLMHFTTHTVLHNLTEGIILVVIILFLFLGNVRGAFIVALTIPFSLLFAAICLDLKHIPANLLSLGALDFGMVVDGAVVMVENIVRHLGHKNENGRRPIEKIAEAAHEVQRPVFYAIGIIISAYLPIFTLQAVEGRLFKPMAWTVAFALLGALLFSMVIAPVLASFLFRKGAKEWHNPVMDFLTVRYRRSVHWAIHHRSFTIGAGVVGLFLAIYLAFGGVIGSEFLPHLDEGALWVRGTLLQSAGPSEGVRVANEARRLLCSFPEVTQCTSQTGRPDDGTDHTGFFNTEYFVDLKPKEQWRPLFHKNKDELIAAMSYQLEKQFPGVIWGFSQPIEDNMEEAVSGVKGQLATKIYGDDLHLLEQKAEEVAAIMGHVRGITDLGVFQVTGQPDLDYTVDRKAAARWGINVADVQDAIQTAVGGNALTQVLRGEARYDLVLRYLPQYRDTQDAINNIRLLSPSGERVSLAQLCTVHEADEGSEIYRENNQRYVAIKYSVRGRDLGGAVEEAIAKVNQQVRLPRGYHIGWEGEYQSEKRAEARLLIIVPLTVLLIFIILYTMYQSFKWAMLILANVALARIGGLLALLITGTNFSVSSGVGFLALFGVSVQTGVIMLEYINQLRARGHSIEESAIEGAVLRLRPILMTMLVATLGLLPAAMSHGIGSDSQRPFAIVIVGGLIADLVMSIFMLPTLYVWIAREKDVLPPRLDEFEN